MFGFLLSDHESPSN